MIDPHFLLTLGFLLTTLGGLLIRKRMRHAGTPANPRWLKRLPASLAETLGLWTMNGAAIMIVFAPDALSELALCLWLLIAATLYWYAAWAEPPETSVKQHAPR